MHRSLFDYLEEGCIKSLRNKNVGRSGELAKASIGEQSGVAFPSSGMLYTHLQHLPLKVLVGNEHSLAAVRAVSL